MGIIPTRGVIGIMIFLACLISYMLRVNISINIIAMVEPVTSKSSSSHVAECIKLSDTSFDNDTHYTEKLTDNTDFGTRYDWDSKTQGLILAAYFWGYILTSMPGGIIAEYFGPVQTIGVTSLLSGALTILMPLAASWHYGVVIAFRICLGLLGGVVYPSLHCLISKWAPPTEKGKFTGALMGGTLGTVVTWPILGAVIEIFGWKWAFFIPGIICIAWCIIWYIAVSNTPEEHKSISDDEKIYIAKCIGDSVQKTTALPPYKSIFLSIPFWALTVSHFGGLWGLHLLLTSGPKYMSEVLGFNLGHSGILAALPYLARLIFGFIFGAIGDVLRAKQIMTVTQIRKWFMLFSHIIPGIFLVCETLIGCNSVLAVAFLTLALGMNGASTITNLQNSQDLAPNYAGTIYGIINCIGGTTGFITPMITGVITEEHSGLNEWRLIFSMGAAVYIGCAIVYCLFGSGVEQKWNKIEQKENKDGIENPAFETVTKIENA